MKERSKTNESSPVFLAYLKNGTVVKVDGKLFLKGYVDKYYIQSIAQAAGLEVTSPEGHELKPVDVLIELSSGEIRSAYGSTEVKVVTGNLEFAQ